MGTADYIAVGKIGSTYGVHGWVKIISFTERAASIVEYTPWYVKEGDAWRPIVITKSRVHGKGVIVKLEGFDTPEQTRLLAGRTISVLRSRLPILKKGEYYWSDLEGLTVINHHGAVLGKVVYLIATGSNDVLVIKGSKEHAIPYILQEVVTEIDLINQTMHVNWEEL